MNNRFFPLCITHNLYTSNYLKKNKGDQIKTHVIQMHFQKTVQFNIKYYSKALQDYKRIQTDAFFHTDFFDFFIFLSIYTINFVFHPYHLQIILIRIQMIRNKADFIIVLICFLLLQSAFGKLQVTNFMQMDSSLLDQELQNIPYSIANFGFAPFGKSMVANIYLTPGLDKQCGTNISEISKQIENSFLLIPRGQCPFVTKALHAQQLGAKMAIIMDNQQHQNTIIMKDNGYGYKVKIPAIFINFKMGQKLVSLIEKTKIVTMKIAFQNQKTQKANVLFYMKSLNRLSYYFLEQWKSYQNILQDKINFQIVYDVIGCPQCSKQDCYYDGAYCTVGYDHGFSATGKLLLDQQLREQIVYEKYQTQYWAYINCINSQCNKISEVKQCSDTCLSKPGFSLKADQLEAQLKKSFDVSGDNVILRKNAEALKNAGVTIYPSIAINSIKIKGSLDAEFVFDDICNTLLNPPKQCSQYIYDNGTSITQVKNSYWLTIVMVLIVCIVVFSLLFVFYRRRMRKRLTQQMQGRVDDMVSKYIQFYSERNNNRA